MSLTPPQALLPEHIIYEDNHLLAINKPAGWPSQRDVREQQVE